MDDMGWVVLAVWALVALVALPLGRHAFTETPLLGLQALIALAGLALAIVYVAGSPDEAIAWIMAGLGVLGAIVVGLAGVWLMGDTHRTLIATQQGHEEVDALLAGIEVWLFISAAFVTFILAAYATTV